MDQYSLLHFATGVLAYFWGVPFWAYASVHVAFEFIENTTQGVNFINKYITFWPGGKPFSDSPINQIGDITFGISGWIISHFLDKWMGNVYEK